VRIVKTVAEFKSLRSQLLKQQARVSLVPTMGALHAGHLNLVSRAKEISDHVVVSIFVNPTQFGPNEDFQKYPRTIERDLDLLKKSGAGSVFLPEPAEMYPKGFTTYVVVEELSQRLCGVSRPVHFRGVATIVLKLFNIIEPDVAVFGQKDAQQWVLIRRMLQDLNLEVEIVVVPTAREPDGLALSSRNQYLSETERRAATILYRCLCWAKQRVEQGEKVAERILQGIEERIVAEPSARLDYAEIVNPDTLEPKATIDGNALLALAVFIGKTRLIDNIVLSGVFGP
jgi:pantoate--beta-alanine ligase